MAQAKNNQNIFDLVPDLENLKDFLRKNDFNLISTPNAGTAYFGEDTGYANANNSIKSTLGDDKHSYNIAFDIAFNS